MEEKNSIPETRGRPFGTYNEKYMEFGGTFKFREKIWKQMKAIDEIALDEKINMLKGYENIGGKYIKQLIEKYERLKMRLNSTRVITYKPIEDEPKG